MRKANRKKTFGFFYRIVYYWIYQLRRYFFWVLSFFLCSSSLVLTRLSQYLISLKMLMHLNTKITINYYDEGHLWWYIQPTTYWVLFALVWMKTTTNKRTNDWLLNGQCKLCSQNRINYCEIDYNAVSFQLMCYLILSHRLANNNWNNVYSLNGNGLHCTVQNCIE